MRLIDADKLDWWYKGRQIRRVIDDAPTVDAVEVVRRRDCEYYCVECMSPGTGWCGYLERGEYDNNFCSYGERKDE